MLLEKLGLADVAGENVLLCRDISFIFQALAPFPAAVEIRPHRVTAELRPVEADAGNALLDDVIIRAAAKPVPDALAALRQLAEQRTLNNASCVQPFPQQPHRTERAGAA
jgi:hypothetical protein